MILLCLMKFKNVPELCGMPKVVSSYLSNTDNRFEAMRDARLIQLELIEGYFKDFAKHSGKINSLHIVSVLENIPIQLSNIIDGSVKRYRFKKVLPHKKSFADLQDPIEWLINAGLIIKVKIYNFNWPQALFLCAQQEISLKEIDMGHLFYLPKA